VSGSGRAGERYERETFEAAWCALTSTEKKREFSIALKEGQKDLTH